MKKYKGYLIDLDGTMYRGKKQIKEAVDLVKELARLEVPYLFVTNNSTRTPDQVVDHLRSFHIPVQEKQVFTTSQATANFIYEKNNQASVYVIGEEGICRALKEKGFVFDEKTPEFVAVGLDRQITYEKLSKACLAVRNGATFVSTNADVVLPTERGFLPGNGSLTSVVAVSTNVKPIFIGKPEPIIMDQALKVLGTKKKETLMIGDNYDTDILAGIRTGLDTLLVYTGVTAKGTAFDQIPTYTVDSLDEWMKYI